MRSNSESGSAPLKARLLQAVNSGIAYVGNVGGSEIVDFTALGDPVNTAARLASIAGAGEALLSETVYQNVEQQFPNLECRTLSIRGKEAMVDVRVLRASAAAILP